MIVKELMRSDGKRVALVGTSISDVDLCFTDEYCTIHKGEVTLLGLISFNWIILWLATDKTSTIISRLFFEKFSSKYKNFDILQYQGMKNWYYWGILIVTLSPSFSSMSKLKDPKCSWSANRVTGCYITLVVVEGRRRSILGKYENRLVIPSCSRRALPATCTLHIAHL